MVNFICSFAILLTIAHCSQVFQSYHPHYLHSYSYPSPSTLHMYYGRVKDGSPLFLIQKGFEDIQTQLFVVNNNTETYNRKAPGATQTSMLPGWVSNIMPGGGSDSKFMLVFTIEDSTKTEEYIERSKIYIERGQYAYLVTLVNSSKVDSYLIRFNSDGEAVKLNELSKGQQIRVKYRDISGNPKNNWRISKNLNWQAASLSTQSILSGMNAVVFEIQIPEKQIRNTRIYIDETEPIRKTQNEDLGALTRRLLTRLDLPREGKVQAPKQPTCEQDAVARIFKGMSYQYGTIHTVHQGAPFKNKPRPLLSFSPSRKRFPWGFLWDDGFHNEIAARSRPELVLKVIKSWLGTLIKGWIPREQRRGDQREQLCNCPMFLNQDDRDGNPPSLMLPLDYLVRKGYLNRTNFQKKDWKRLKQWHAWFMQTQMTAKNSYLFKWYDHIQSNGSFNSGLDDFPRPINGQFYVDTQAWMYFFTKVMHNVSRVLEDDTEVILKYEYQAKKIKQRAQVFLDHTRNIYSDISTIGYHLTWSSHVGYPSLLPLAFGMIDKDSPAFQGSLNLIQDRALLNSGFGLTSISQQAREYLENQNAYWKGPVWMNINYLVLRGLKLYYPEQSKIYTSRREEIISTVCGEWERTGFFFENYIKGKGSFSSPFNGWTSLIALVVNQNY